MGNCAVPLMLLSLGVALSRLRVAGIGRALAMSALRLGLGFAVGLAVATAMGLEGTLRGVVMLESAMPVAVFNYLWAVRYNTAPEVVAGMVLASTACPSSLCRCCCCSSCERPPRRGELRQQPGTDQGGSAGVA